MIMSEAEESVKPLLGVWKCDNSRTENFEEFLAEMGVNFMVRKLAKRGSPTMTISVEDGKLIVKTEAGLTTRVTTVPLDGTEVEEEQFGGAKSKSNFAIIDGKAGIVSIPADPKLKKTVLTREIVNDELEQIINVGDVICKRIFTKQA